MTKIFQINTMKDIVHKVKKNNKTIGFVPTMGALHNGHMQLIKQARAENEIVIVSIFVNPTQFLQHEDLDRYPSKIEADIKICELLNVDYLFLPDTNTMYKKNEILIKAPIIDGYVNEGYNRPGHFDGVLQIVLKLFNITNPTNAYFGKKDAQQLCLVKRMVENFYLNINIVECETIREQNGLAMSSRNIYLKEPHLKEALKISESLKVATKCILGGILECDTIILKMKKTLQPIKIQYISVVNRNFEHLNQIEIKNSIILVAVKINNIRLIDNIWI